MSPESDPSVVADGLPFPVLDALLGSPAAGFFQRDWKCRTRRFPVETAADRLALAGLDFRAAVSMALSAGKLEVFGGKGRSGPAPGQPGWPEVEDAPSARVSGVQDLVPSLDGLCQRLSQELSHRVSVNLYVSPPHSRGLDRHQDGHDVLVLQVEGRKRWRIWKSDAPPPLDALPALTFEGSKRLRNDYRGTPFGGHAISDEQVVEPPVLDFETSPGDLIYVPGGWAHEVWTEGSYSAHLTFGIHLVSWVDLLVTVVSQASRRHGAIRTALPIGFARVAPGTEQVRAKTREMLALLGDSDGAEALEEVVGRWMCRGLADVPNETRVEPLPALVPELRLRRSGPVAIVYRSDSVGLCRPSQTGTDVWFPMAFAKALRFVATVEPPEFTVRDVPGVSAPSRARLCQLLLEQGYVQLLAS